MKTDRELMKFAAKAHGNLLYVEGMNSWIHADEAGNRGAWWNPLTDDGDALRLAVKMKLAVVIRDDDTRANQYLNDSKRREFHDADPYAATRRAIVRAAAAIGEAMP